MDIVFSDECEYSKETLSYSIEITEYKINSTVV